MADPQQSPVPVPMGSFYSRTIGSSSLYVGVPAISQGGGTGSFAATLTGIQAGDLLQLEPPLDLATGASSVSYIGFRISDDTVTVLFHKSTTVVSSNMYVVVPVMAAGGTGSYAASVPGVNPGDFVSVEVPVLYGIGTNSVQYNGFVVSAANTVTLNFANASGISTPVGTVNTWRYEYVSAAASTAQTAKAWRYLWWDLTPKAEIEGQNPT